MDPYIEEYWRDVQDYGYDEFYTPCEIFHMFTSTRHLFDQHEHYQVRRTGVRCDRTMT